MPDLINRLALGLSNCRDLTAVFNSVQTAMAAGVNGVFLAEDIGCRDAFEIAGAITSTTDFGDRDPEITISVTNPYLRSPGALFQSLATLEELGLGSVTLGLGSSSAGIITGQLGYSYGDSVGVMREAILAIRAVASDRSHPLDLRILVAAMGPRMLRLAGELADEVILNTGTTPAYASWARAQIVDGAEAVGRDSGLVAMNVWVPMYLGPEPYAERLSRAKLWAASMLSIPRQGELLLQHAGLDDRFLPDLRRVCSAYPHRGDARAGAAIVPDPVAETLAIVGSAEKAVSRIRAFITAGVSTVVTGLPSILQLTGLDQARELSD